jgi:hypothetical protein
MTCRFTGRDENALHGFWIPQKSAIIRSNPDSSGECQLKEGHRMGRNYLAHRAGDAANARARRRWLRLRPPHSLAEALVVPNPMEAGRHRSVQSNLKMGFFTVI